MKIEKRDLVKCIILTIVTCGIYSIFWAINLAKDAVKVKDENDDGTLEIVLCILLPFLGFYLAERKLTEGCEAKGIPHKDNSIIYLVLGLLGLAIVDFALMQNDLNKIADFFEAGGAPYGGAPYGAPQGNPYGGAPYGAPQNNPYGAPQGNPYGAPQNNPYGAPQNNPYGAPQNNPYGAPQNNPYGAPQNNPPQGNPYGAPQGNPYEAPQSPADGGSYNPPYGGNQ